MSDTDICVLSGGASLTPRFELVLTEHLAISCPPLRMAPLTRSRVRWCHADFLEGVLQITQAVWPVRPGAASPNSSARYRLTRHRAQLLASS